MSIPAERQFRIALLACLLLAFGLRVARLDHQELRGDEAFGYAFIQRTYQEMVNDTIRLAEPHPVASYFAQKAWLGWAGDSPFALRFVSVWFSVLAVALLYRLARRLALGRRTALLGMGLLALSPYAVWHSQDARMYGMSMALTIASTWLALEFLARRRWAWAVGYVGVSWLALHTHYFAAFVIVAQSVFVAGWVAFGALVRHRLKSASATQNTLKRTERDPPPRQDDDGAVGLLLSWVGMQVVLGLCYAPWLWRVGEVLRGYQGNGDSPNGLEMLVRATGVFAVGESASNGERMVFGAFAVVLSVVAIGWLVQGGSAGRRAAGLLILYLWLPLVMMWLSAQSRPIFSERYLLAAAPPFYLLLAAAITYRPPGVRAPIPMPAVPTQRARTNPEHLFTFMLMLIIAGMMVSLYKYYTA